MDEEVKALLAASQLLYQQCYANLDTIMDMCEKQQGKDFNADVTYEILIDFMNGELPLEDCLQLLEGGDMYKYYNRFEVLNGEKV